jgi:transcriptional regulator with XRE-family HTH domain
LRASPAARGQRAASCCAATPFGERLHAARIATGLSQAQLAERLGITQTSYAAWERYSVALRPDQIEQVIEILGISPNDLFGKKKKLVRKKQPS